MSYSFSFPGFLGLRFYSPQFRFSATENLEWPWRFVGNSFASFNSTSILLLTITQINYSMRIYKGCVVGVNSPSYAVRNEDSRYEIRRKFRCACAETFREFVPVTSLAPTLNKRHIFHWPKTTGSSSCLVFTPKMPSYKFSFKFIKSSKKLLRMNAANIPSLAQIQKTLTWFSILVSLFCFRSRDLQAAESFRRGISWERRRHHLLVGTNDQQGIATNEYAVL